MHEVHSFKRVVVTGALLLLISLGSTLPLKLSSTWAL